MQKQCHSSRPAATLFEFFSAATGTGLVATRHAGFMSRTHIVQAQALDHAAKIRVSMGKEFFIRWAQVVQGMIMLVRVYKTVLWTSAMTGELKFAAMTLLRQFVKLGLAKSLLCR